MGPYELAHWVGSCGDWIGALALIVVGLVFARPVSAQAGFLVAGGGLVQLLSTCCVGIVGSPQFLVRFGRTAPLHYGQVCGAPLAEALCWGLVAFGVVSLVRGAPARGAGGTA